MALSDRDDRARSPHQSLNDLGRDIRKGRSPRDAQPAPAPRRVSPYRNAGPAPAGVPVMDRPEPRGHRPRVVVPAPATDDDWSDESLRERMHGVLADEHAQDPQRGLPALFALGVLLVIAGAGGLIDMASGSTVRGWFNISFILGSIVAILAVRRRSMFPVVVAPPIVYAAASGTIIYLRSGGLSNRSVLIDGAANWLIYGFPSLAAATAAVLIIAGLRTILRK